MYVYVTCMYVRICCMYVYIFVYVWKHILFIVFTLHINQTGFIVDSCYSFLGLGFMIRGKFAPPNRSVASNAVHCKVYLYKPIRLCTILCVCVRACVRVYYA